MPERFVLTRHYTGGALSVVSGDYLVVQPAEVLEFYRDFVAQQHYTLETASALDGGRKMWALAKTGMVANVAENATDQRRHNRLDQLSPLAFEQLRTGS